MTDASRNCQSAPRAPSSPAASSSHSLQSFASARTQTSKKPLTDATPCSEAPFSYNVAGFSFCERDTEECTNVEISNERQHPKKRPFSFVINGSPRWTRWSVLALVVSVLALGAAIAALVVVHVQNQRGLQSVKTGADDATAAVASTATAIASSTADGEDAPWNSPVPGPVVHGHRGEGESSKEVGSVSETPPTSSTASTPTTISTSASWTTSSSYPASTAVDSASPTSAEESASTSSALTASASETWTTPSAPTASPTPSVQAVDWAPLHPHPHPAAAHAFPAGMGGAVVYAVNDEQATHTEGGGGEAEVRSTDRSRGLASIGTAEMDGVVGFEASVSATWGGGPGDSESVPAFGTGGPAKASEGWNASVTTLVRRIARR